jgi:hypothetical protein
MVSRTSGVLLLLAIGLLAAPPPARADVITDWNERALTIIVSISSRELAMMNLAMFQCINAIEPRYEPYKFTVKATPTTSKQAASATAAASILLKAFGGGAASIKGKIETALQQSLAQVPDGRPKSDGIALGRQVAETIWNMRARDGSDAVDDYRPKTTPGRYVPTTVVGSTIAKVAPFVLDKASQFRPGPPIALTSREWADDFNEIRSLGRHNSVSRTAAQTETAEFWFFVGPGTFNPIAVQAAQAAELGICENARLFALVAMATADTAVAVYDAKFHYEFWRPITAIRNGDIDDNPRTERDATWDPMDHFTPEHPEYPCAHCALSSAAARVIEAFVGDGTVPEFSLRSPTAPGVTHRWTRLEDYADEVSNARVWAGFHYRFSTRVGAELGRQVADYVLHNSLRPSGR